MLKSNQRGFTGFEIALLLLVIALIGFAGYTVYEKNKAVEPTSQNVIQKSENLSEAVKTADAKIPSGWKKYDSNSSFSFIYPESWTESLNVKEFPISHVFEVKFLDKIQLNSAKDGWIYAPGTDTQVTGKDADVKKEDRTDISIWNLGFGDAGNYADVPTFVAKNAIYQINTPGNCESNEDNPGCVPTKNYDEDYKTLIQSIKLK